MNTQTLNKYGLILLVIFIPLILFLIYKRKIKINNIKQQVINKIYHNKINLFLYPFITIILSIFVIIYTTLIDHDFYQRILTLILTMDVNVISNLNSDQLLPLIVYSLIVSVGIISFYILYALERKRVNIIIFNIGCLTQSLQKRIKISRNLNIVVIIIGFIFFMPTCMLFLEAGFILFKTSNILLLLEGIVSIIVGGIGMYSLYVILKNALEASQIIKLPVYIPNQVNMNTLHQLQNKALKLDIKTITIFADQKTYLPEITINKTTYFYMANLNGDVCSFLLVYDMFINLFENYIQYENEQAFITIPSNIMVDKIKNYSLQQTKEVNYENKL